LGIFCLGKPPLCSTMRCTRKITIPAMPGTVAFRNLDEKSKESLDMKKLLTLLFAAALAFSLSAASFAQDTATPDKKADTKKEEKAEKKAAKKKAKKEKKEEKKEEKKNDMK
jgi:hypothetical protein